METEKLLKTIAMHRRELMMAKGVEDMDKRGDRQQAGSMSGWMDGCRFLALSGFPVVGGLPSLLSLL